MVLLVDWGDYDNDGDIDLLITGSTMSYPNSNPVTEIYKNEGNNTFSKINNTSIDGVSEGHADWGDFDNDGDLDLS